MEQMYTGDRNETESVDLMRLAGRDAIRAILSEDARVASLPIIQKAGKISDLINAFAEVLGNSEAENQYKTVLIAAGFEVCNKLVLAESSHYYNDKLEQALLVKMAIKKVLHQLAGIDVLGLSDINYSNLIKSEIEEFRIIFNEWVLSFDKSTFSSDGWNIPL